jgi:hypothetical protein
MHSFSAKIFIIGVNPYVLLPQKVLKGVFAAAEKSKGPIPVSGTLDGHKFIQTLVKFSGKWRLYLNTPMRKAAKKDVGDVVEVTLQYDPKPRLIPMHPDLVKALEKNKKAKAAFEVLAPYRKKEIIRYIASMKTEESRKRNIERSIQHLQGKARFVGRD